MGGIGGIGGNLRSIRAMLLAVAAFSAMDAALKVLTADFPVMQVVALRAFTSLPLVCAWLMWRGALRSALRVHWPMQILRAALGIVCLLLFAYGVRLLSLAEAYAIYFVAPLLITALSVPMLGERVDAARWSAIVAGLAGVVVILRPSGAGMLTLGGMAVLGSAVCYALSAITARILARSDSGAHMVFWYTVLMALGAGILAAPAWRHVGMQHAPTLVVLALTGFVGQIAVTEAFSHGEASVVAPFEYTALAWGVGIDWLLWHTLPDGFTLLGAAIIIGSGLFLLRHETRRPAVAPP